MEKYTTEELRSLNDSGYAYVDVDVILNTKLTITAKVMFTLLCEYSLPGDTRPFPSVKTLAADLGISLIAAERAYHELEAQGLIARIQNRRLNNAD